MRFYWCILEIHHDHIHPREFALHMTFLVVLVFPLVLTLPSTPAPRPFTQGYLLGLPLVACLGFLTGTTLTLVL